MSRLSEYLASAIGYDQNGLPASTTQLTFGFTPFQIADTENLADVTEVTTACHTDAIVDLKIIDQIVMVSFDFANEMETFDELYGELDHYIQQKDHVTKSLNTMAAELGLARMNNDEQMIEDIQIKMKSMSIPFMLPTIMPVEHGGTVHITFGSDPKFIVFESSKITQPPTKVTMFFDVDDLLCQDEVAIYQHDAEEELRLQQEEMWYMQEAKKAEEEAYQSQYGFNAFDVEEDVGEVDKRLKGARFK